MPQFSNRNVETTTERFRNPMETIRRARRGSEEDFKFMLVNVKHFVAQPAVCEAAIEMFLGYLKQPSVVPRDAEMTIMLTLVSVSTRIRILNADESLLRLNQIIKRRRPFLLSWLVKTGSEILSKLKKTVVEDDKSNLTYLLDVLDGFCLIIRDGLSFLQDEDCTVPRGDELCDLLVQSWLVSSVVKQSNPSCSLTISSVFCIVFSHPCFSSRGDQVLRSARAAGYTSESVMKMALESLIDDFRIIESRAEAQLDPFPGPTIACIRGHLLFVSALVSGRRSDETVSQSSEIFNKSFLEIGGLQKVLRGLLSILLYMKRTPPEDDGKKYLVLELVAETFKLINSSLQVIRTFDFITLGVLKKIGKVLIYVSPFFEDLIPEGQHAIYLIFGEHLMSWLSFRSTAKRLRHVKAINDSVVKRKPFRLMRNSALHSLWEVLIYHLASSGEFHEKIQAGFENEYIGCNNNDCDRQGRRHDFQICAGCETAAYCSRTCAKNGWKKYQHKTYCQQVASLHKSSRLPTVRDMFYFAHFALSLFLDNLLDEKIKLPVSGKGVVLDLTPLKPSDSYMAPGVGEFFDLDTVKDEPSYKIRKTVRKPRPEGVDRRFIVMLKPQYLLGLSTYSLLVTAGVTFAD